MARLRRLILPAMLGLAAYWAVFGGEYSVFEVRRARQGAAAEAAALERLRQEIDSLQARADSLESDSAALERLAREHFGMIRDGEVLYRFAEPEPPDSVPSGPGGGGR
ncbi:MAG: septum formation initiator family protein [Gemmatimonadetes bacterium]|nr:septum formation initiator family protein [Gemmatimonadota bacterium]